MIGFLMAAFQISSHAQSRIEHGFLIHKFENINSECFKVDEDGLILVSIVYSKEKLKLGEKDLKTFSDSDKITLEVNKYRYYLMSTYERDRVGKNYVLKRVDLENSIANVELEKLKFKKLPEKSTVFECFDKIYDNVLVNKVFFSTNTLISKSLRKKEVLLQLIDDKCEIVESETLSQDISYSAQDSFLVIRNKNQIIIVCDYGK